MIDNMLLFSAQEGNILIRLLLAHILGDFVLQTKGMVANKAWLSKSMFLHIAVIYGTAALLTGWWFIALLLAATHYIIDGLKISLQRKHPGKELFLFVADQLLHVAVIVALWGYQFNAYQNIWRTIQTPFTNYNMSLFVLAYAIVIFPTGYIIKFITKDIQVTTTGSNSNTAVQNGGQLIGIFERIIILTFVLLHQYEAIGFLITGKSIIRFAGSEHIRSEYVLVGTMASYAIAIAVGIIAKWLLALNTM